jgi:hypothetical protein
VESVPHTDSCPNRYKITVSRDSAPIGFAFSALSIILIVGLLIDLRLVKKPLDSSGPN